MSTEGLRVVVAGLGPMGCGIARVFAQSGADVSVYDVDAAAVAAGLERILADLPPGLAVRAAPSLEEAVASADLFVEAIVERQDVKAELLARVRGAAPDSLVVASNTSSLSIGELGVAYGLPEQVVGMHFFNPPEKMRLIEVIRGPRTAPEVVSRAEGWAAALGKTAIVCADSPNFVVNRVCRPLYYEAQLLATQGVAPAVVDSVARGALGHRMGPLELLDFVGLHTHLGSSETAYRELGDPRYRPIPRTRSLVRAGATGRAAGQGWYDYSDGSPADARAAVLVERQEAAGRISIVGPGRDLLLANAAVRAACEDRPALAVYSAPSSCTTGDVAAVHELVVRCVNVAVDSSHPGWLEALPPGVAWIRLHTLQEQPFAEVVSDREAAIAPEPFLEQILGALGASSVEVPALPGLVGDRLMYGLINEALTVVEEGIATEEAVDLALRLGMNHPIGPFAYLERVGDREVLAGLRAMLDGFGDPRYRPSPLLLRRAAGAQRGRTSALTERSLRLPI